MNLRANSYILSSLTTLFLVVPALVLILSIKNNGLFALIGSAYGRMLETCIVLSQAMWIVGTLWVVLLDRRNCPATKFSLRGMTALVGGVAIVVLITQIADVSVFSRVAYGVALVSTGYLAVIETTIDQDAQLSSVYAWASFITLGTEEFILFYT